MKIQHFNWNYKCSILNNLKLDRNTTHKMLTSKKKSYGLDL